MPRHRFPKDNKFAKGGPRPGSGPPTKAEVMERELTVKMAKEIIERNAEKLAKQLVSRAMSKKGERSLHKAIDKLIPDARQAIDVNLGGFDAVIRDLEAAREAARKKQIS